MTDVPMLAAGAVIGLLLGLGFFWGLWRTLDGLDRSRRPGLRVLLSVLLRIGILVFALYACMHYLGWQATIAAVAAFTLVRLLVVQVAVPRASAAEIES